MRFVVYSALSVGFIGMGAAATPYTGFAPAVTQQNCFIVLPVEGMLLTDTIAWDQPCTPGTIVEGTGKITIQLGSSLLSESVGTLTGGYLHGTWSVTSTMIGPDGSRRGLGTTDMRLNMGCAIKYDDVLANPACVPGKPLPMPPEDIAIADADSFAYAVWRTQKSAAKPVQMTARDYAIPAYETRFCLEIGTAAEGPRGQAGGRTLVNTCAVPVAAAWCVYGGAKGCETGDGHVMPIPARTAVVLPPEEPGHVSFFACSGKSVRPVVTDAGTTGFYCD